MRGIEEFDKTVNLDTRGLKWSKDSGNRRIRVIDGFELSIGSKIDYFGESVDSVNLWFTFFFIFFLFQNEHVMVEELLKLFICVIDTKLFKSVEVENFKTSNILIFGFISGTYA